MSLGRIFATLYAIVFLALSVLAALSFLQSYRELANLRQQERENRQRLVAAEERLQEQETMLRQLAADPAFVETAIRRRLGYVKPDEVVFRFRE
jgi:cell division protein FtsB